MKKTLTVNLGGIVFHIDEDAYLELSQYFENLRKHFSKMEEREEIYNDIELRISEILQEKISGAKQVITIEDIREVIGIMGQPWQFETEGKDGAEASAGPAEKTSKRFFRDPDEKMIAGVCSGIGIYFHLDPVWVRLIFAITVFFGGFGILSYLILWIAMPEAKSTTDRLQMRGQKINISNIEKTVREEMGGFRDKLGSMASDSASALRRAGARSGVFFEAFGKALLTVLLFFWKILIILTGIALVVFGLGFLVILFAFTFGWSDYLVSEPGLIVLSFPEMAGILLGCNIPVAYLQVIMLIVLGIPFFMLLYNGTKMIFRFERVRYLGLTMFNIWVVGVVFLVFFVLSTYNLFRTGDESDMNVVLEKPAADTLYLNLRPEDPGMKYLDYPKFTFGDNLRSIVSDEGELYIVPRIKFEKSLDSLLSVKQTLSARGKTQADARQRLAAIRYQLTTTGSTISLGPFGRLPKGECWRGQAVDILISVPKGRIVRIDRKFHDLKPYWYYLRGSEEEPTLIMTDHGLEQVENVK